MRALHLNFFQLRFVPSRLDVLDVTICRQTLGDMFIDYTPSRAEGFWRHLRSEDFVSQFLYCDRAHKAITKLPDLYSILFDF
jgi:hypothetical protein